MNFQYKLGKRPAVKPYGLGTMTTYSMGRLPSPPAQTAVPAVNNWQMLANGPDPTCHVIGAPFGDCVIAGVAHVIMASNAQTGEHDPIPSSDAVAHQYLALTGGPDTGLNEYNVLKTWRSTGLFGGNTIEAFVPLGDDNSIPHVQIAIAFYGSCIFGVALPESAFEQTQANVPWTPLRGSPIAGGHCIVGVGYDARYLYAVTWGQIVAIAWPWLAAYVDEAYCVITPEVVEAKHGPGNLLDLTSLKADLDALSD